MDTALAVWSYISQLIGYVGWCASGSDPACRPFVAFLALAGASFGGLALLTLALVGILNSWEREIEIARASAAEVSRAEGIREKLRVVPRSEPVVSLGAAAASLAGGEPFLAGALRVDTASVRAAGAPGMPLGPSV